MKMKMAVGGATLSLAWFAGAVATAGASGGAAASAYNYTGSAYGTSATAASTVESGPTAPVGSGGCGTGPGYSMTQSVASVSASPLLSTGAVRDSVVTEATRTNVSSAINHVQLLGGQIDASVVEAVSTTTAGSGGNVYSTNGSQLVGLTVDGRPIAASPAPNTTLALPGVGRVVLNEQIRTGSTLTVNMIHVYVTHAQTGVPANTSIIVGHAASGLTARSASVLGGGAYGAAGSGGGRAELGPQWPVSLCSSTNAQNKTNSGLGVNAAGTLDTGTISNTVNASGTKGSATGRSTSTVQRVSLLSGLVSADAIRAAANVSQAGSAVTASDQGSSLVNLVVNGKPVAANAAANTQINVGNITVWVHRVIKRPNGIDVRMLEIVVHGSNRFGLPAGADIQVARAYMSVFPAA